MVKRVLLGTLLALWLGPVAAASLVATLDKKISGLGAPLQLRITGPANLSELDLAPLKKDFEVFSSAASSSSDRGREHAVLDVTLYPLHSGKLMLPTLALGTAHTRPIPIEIQPANVSLRAWLTPEFPMEREAAMLHLEIRDDGSLNWVMPAQLDAPHLMLRPVAEPMRDNTPDTLHDYRWMVLPLKDGSLGIDFGMLDAYQFGQRLRFPLSAVSFRAQAAPRYLPLHVPIGKPAIHADAPPKQIIAGQPVAWNMDIDAPGLSVEGALKLLQFDTPPGLRFYAPSVTPLKRDGRDGLRLTLTFVAEPAADTFPTLHLAYFDPKTQRIEALAIPAAHFTVRDPVREKIIAFGGVALGLLLLASLTRQAWPWVRRLRVRRAWLARLASAHDPASLYQALTQAAPWRAPTLEHWPEQVRLGIAPALRAQLAQLRFGLHSNEIAFLDLKQAWQRACARLPLRCFT